MPKCKYDYPEDGPRPRTCPLHGLTCPGPKQYTNTREPGEFGDGVTVEREDESVVAKNATTASTDKLEVVGWRWRDSENEPWQEDHAWWSQSRIDEMRAKHKFLEPLVRHSDATRIITEQAERIAELERERDDALETENEAKDCFWAIYPDWVDMKGHGITTEAARTLLADRAEAAEADRDRMKEALESCPSDADFANAEGFRQAINSWWNITARAALSNHRRASQ